MHVHPLLVLLAALLLAGCASSPGPNLAAAEDPTARPEEGVPPLNAVGRETNATGLSNTDLLHLGAAPEMSVRLPTTPANTSLSLDTARQDFPTAAWQYRFETATKLGDAELVLEVDYPDGVIALDGPGTFCAWAVTWDLFAPNGTRDQFRPGCHHLPAGAIAAGRSTIAIPFLDPSQGGAVPGSTLEITVTFYAVTTKGGPIAHILAGANQDSFVRISAMGIPA